MSGYPCPKCKLQLGTYDELVRHMQKHRYLPLRNLSTSDKEWLRSIRIEPWQDETAAEPKG